MCVRRRTDNHIYEYMTNEKVFNSMLNEIIVEIKLNSISSMNEGNMCDVAPLYSFPAFFCQPPFANLPACLAGRLVAWSVSATCLNGARMKEWGIKRKQFLFVKCIYVCNTPPHIRTDPINKMGSWAIYIKHFSSFFTRTHRRRNAILLAKLRMNHNRFKYYYYIYHCI